MRKHVILVALVGAFVATQVPLASASAGHVPAAVRAMCKHNHAFCSGYWTRVGGRTVYMIGTPMTVGAGSAHATAVTGWHTLRNYGVNQCMSSYGVSGNDNGGAISHYGCNGSANQTWDVYYQGAWDNYFGHWGFINQGDSLCINNRNGSLATNNTETLWACDATSQKQWYQFVDGGLGIQVWGNGPNSGVCLTSLGYTLYGDPVYLSGCNGSANQKWGA
jgi:hypothetical protein